MRKPRAATIAAALATALALFAGFPIPAHAEIRTSDVILGTTAADRGIVQGELPDITAPHAMVLGQDGLAYYERNADEPIKIASVTKVMTALVALEHCELTDIVTVDYAAATVGESSLGLLEGDALTMEDALTGLMVMSGNDAATAIAIAAGAKIDPATTDPYSTFIEAMNQKAKELGCTDTVFENPHGLDFDSWAGDLHSTTRDITAVFSAAMKNESFRAIDNSDRTSISVTSADGTQRTLTLTVRNQIHGQEGNIGGKTGTTMEAGNCFVGAFSRENGGEVYVAIFGAADNDTRFVDTLALANWYYDHIATVPYINTPVTRNGVPLVGEATCSAWCDRTAAVTLEDPNATFSVFSLGDELVQDVKYDKLDGAVEQGATVGTMSLRQGDVTVGSANLVSAESVPEPNPIEWLMIKFDRLIRLFEGRPSTAESVVVNEAADPLGYDNWNAA